MKSMLQDHLDMIREYKAMMDEALKVVGKALSNKDELSLEERWDAFVTIHSLLPIESFGDGFIDDINPGWTMYDDFYIDRHQTISYPDMLERIVDMGDELATEEALNMWKERVLATGHGGFEYDW